MSGHTLVVDYARSVNGGSGRFSGAEPKMIGIPGVDS